MYNDKDLDIIQQSYDDFPDVEGKIVSWADDRNLIDGSTAKDQMVKLMEEMGELAGGICRMDETIIKDSIGDVFVVLSIIAAQLGVDVEGCAMLAYDEIKYRTGKMVDGVFVKAEDLGEL